MKKILLLFIVMFVFVNCTFAQKGYEKWLLLEEYNNKNCYIEAHPFPGGTKDSILIRKKIENLDNGDYVIEGFTFGFSDKSILKCNLISHYDKNDKLLGMTQEPILSFEDVYTKIDENTIEYEVFKLMYEFRKKVDQRNTNKKILCILLLFETIVLLYFLIKSKSYIKGLIFKKKGE